MNLPFTGAGPEGRLAAVSIETVVHTSPLASFADSVVRPAGSLLMT